MAQLKNCGFVALDGLDPLERRRLLERLEGEVYGAKFTDALDQDACQALTEARFSGLVTWADAKYNDVPATVANRVAQMLSYGADFVSVHISGGVPMMQAAVRTFEGMRPGSEIGGILGISVLTSFDDADCRRVFYRGVDCVVGQFAEDAAEAGLAGMTCSPLELHLFQDEDGSPRPCLATPGIVEEGVPPGGHKRYAPAAFALEHGARFIVVGKAITRASDPIEAIRRIDESIAHLP